MKIRVIEESGQYHVFVGDKDLWLSRIDLICLRHELNSLAMCKGA
ncbi:MAG: hypothetical protein SO188_14280 [Prevotella sp.]|nr:hypothetical protein [Prevotella sp.]